MTSLCLGIDSIIIDLSHPFDNDTIFWPGGEGYSHCINVYGKASTHYSAGNFTCAEHGGTHVDAPFHFAENGITVDQIPINQLVAPCSVIDISKNCETTSNYSLTKDDILEFEHIHGNIETGTIVLIKTSWWKKYADSAEYLGFNPKEGEEYDPQTSNLSFPGISDDAALLLLHREVIAVGLDTASLDNGASKDFSVHRILLSGKNGNDGVYGIENINGEIEKLPAKGTTLFVLPMKIKGGTGAPARIVAVIPSK